MTWSQIRFEDAISLIVACASEGWGVDNVHSVSPSWRIPEYLLPELKAARLVQLEDGVVLAFMSMFDPNTRVPEPPACWKGTP